MSYLNKKIPIKNLESEAIFNRIFEITQCKTQHQLAHILNIAQSSVSDARGRGQVPDNWVLKLIQLYGVNPQWIKTGVGEKFITSDSLLAHLSSRKTQINSQENSSEKLVFDMLKCLPDAYIIKEFYRRKKNNLTD